MIPVNTPATAAYALSKEDFVFGTPTKLNAALPAQMRALYVGTTGDVVVKTISGQSVTFKNVPSGAILPICIKQLSAATTATDVVGLI